MNWWSETALLWLPKAGHPYPEDFATRALPGSCDFYYLTLDAFDAISRRRRHDDEHEPWVYILEDYRILSPAEIDGLMEEWRVELEASRAETGGGGFGRPSPASESFQTRNNAAAAAVGRPISPH